MFKITSWGEKKLIFYALFFIWRLLFFAEQNNNKQQKCVKTKAEKEKKSTQKRLPIFFSLILSSSFISLIELFLVAFSLLLILLLFIDKHRIENKSAMKSRSLNYLFLFLEMNFFFYCRILEDEKNLRNFSRFYRKNLIWLHEKLNLNPFNVGILFYRFLIFLLFKDYKKFLLNRKLL